MMYYHVRFAVTLPPHGERHRTRRLPRAWGSLEGQGESGDRAVHVDSGRVVRVRRPIPSWRSVGRGAHPPLHRTAVLCRSRPGLQGLGPGRPRVHRPQHVLRRCAPRSRAPRGPTGDRVRAGHGRAVRVRDASPGRSGPQDHRVRAVRRARPLHTVGHGDDVARGADRPGLHRPDEGGQVRGPLPRVQ